VLVGHHFEMYKSELICVIVFEKVEERKREITAESRKGG